MSNHTEIHKIQSIYEEDLENNIDFTTESNISKYILDLSLSLQTRIKALNLYYNQNNDDTIEIINKLSMMYEISGTKVLREFLYQICKNTILPPFLQSICAKTLCTYNEKDDLGYEAVDLVYPKFNQTIATPYKIDFIKLLMKNEKYKHKATSYFCEIINDQNINCDYRYKSILGLENNYESFILAPCKQFALNILNKTEYRILACQNLLKRSSESSIEEVLLQFANDTNLNYNLRADATDVLLQLGSPNVKSIAQTIIMKLGIGNKNIHTLYDNAQNVHTKEVEDSVKEALEFLQNFGITEHNGKKITIEYIQAQIINLANKQSKFLDKIEVSLNRILIDRSLYSKYNCTLSHILLQVWSYISGHKYQEEMQKRLIQELEDMAGTCSSGFATRLINTISGFGEFSIRISWRDQITSNLTARINKQIQDMDNLTLQEKVMNEMTLETTRNEDRKHFLKFLRQHVFHLRDNLYHEFKNYITDTDFDLYFRAAISMYETGQFI
jgi:hypothetical protein